MLLTIILLLMGGPLTALGVVQFFTNGESGPQCGNSKCLGQGLAECVNGECVCQGQAVKGLGNFVCVRQDEDFAVIFNDPMIIAFNGYHTKAPLICKFLAAHISTTICTGATPDNVIIGNGMCDLRFYAWGRRKRGKTFVKGIEVKIMVAIGNITYHHLSRIDAESFNGLYMFSEDGNTDPFGAGEFGDPVTTFIPDLGSIHTVYDHIDNFARIIVEPCGIEVGIRGVEQLLGNPLLLPAGVYIKVLKACQPEYLSSESAIFSPPLGHGPSLIEQAETLSQTINVPVSTTLLTVVKTLSGQNLQNFPGVPLELIVLTEIVQQCDLASLCLALPACLFYIESPRYFNCIDKTTNGNAAVGLLGMCIFSMCDSNRLLCQYLQNGVIESGCQSRLIPGQETILDFDCNSL